MDGRLPNVDDIKRAADTIEGFAVRTPLLQNNRLNALTGGEVFIKPENLQRTGSFKFRGAYNAIAILSEEERKQGIAASSSGNHAQGIGTAASMFGAKATIVMPSDAPAAKVDGTKATGAKVVFYDRASQDREQALAQVVEKDGSILIHPYENANVIAGQGTVGLEIVQDMQAMGRKIDRLLVCTGGGGLTAGVAMAIHGTFPDARIHSVEPEAFDDYRRSLEEDRVVGNEKTTGSICDAILTPAPGQLSFSINRELLSKGLVVSDEEALAAVRFAFSELKLVVEPGGAVALAALLKHGKDWSGETIVIVISGGNVDPGLFSKAID